MINESVVHGSFSLLLTPGPFLRKAKAVIRGSESEKTSTLCALVLGSRLGTKRVNWLWRRASRNGGTHLWISPLMISTQYKRPVLLSQTHPVRQSAAPKPELGVF